MIEIIILIFLTRHIGELALRKGERPGPWKWKTVGAWFLAEFIGCMLGMMLFGMGNIYFLMFFGIFCAFGGYLYIRRLLEKMPDEEEADPNSEDLL